MAMIPPPAPSTAVKVPPRKTSFRLTAIQLIRTDAGAATCISLTPVAASTASWVGVVACSVGWSGISDGVAAGEGNCRWHLVQNFDPGWFQFAPQYGQGGDVYASTATDYPISSARSNPLAGGLTLAECYKAVARSITEMSEALVAAAGPPQWQDFFASVPSCWVSAWLCAG